VIGTVLGCRVVVVSWGVWGCGVGKEVARRDALLTFGSSLTTLCPFFDIIRTPMGIMLILVASGFVPRRTIGRGKRCFMMSVDE